MAEIVGEEPANDWSGSAATFNARARKHEISAKLDMAMIVMTLIACIVIFAGADKLTAWLFSTPAERRADLELSNAKAQIVRAFASLGDPASELIRSLSPKLGPFIDQWLADKRKKDEPVPAEGREVPYRPPLARAPQPETRRALSAAQRTEVMRLYEQLIGLYEKNAALHSSLESERERTNATLDRMSIEQTRADSHVEAVRVRADADRDIAQSNASVQTERIQDMTHLISSTFTRIGAVVMVIWLIKIFVRKRQRSVELSAFYLAVADALNISKGDTVRFREILPHLTPVEHADKDNTEPPVESLGKTLLALSKKAD